MASCTDGIWLETGVGVAEVGFLPAGPPKPLPITIAVRFRLLATLSGQKSLFVVLGPSGSGKSSFLRAGLIPRLQREDRWFVVLGIMRPERNALTGDHSLAAAIHAARQALQCRAHHWGRLKAPAFQIPTGWWSY